MLVSCTLVFAQETPVDRVVSLHGATLSQGHKEATRLAASRTFWVAYQVAVKPNVAIDTHAVSVPWDPTIHGPDVSVNVASSTPALGIFIRYDGDKATEVQVLNLLRKHDFGETPVFWLGKAVDAESLSSLETLLKDRPDLGVGLIRAIGVHRDSSSAVILERYAASPVLAGNARDEAFCWIGQTAGQSSFLSEIATDSRLSLDERSAAVLALLASSDPDSRQVIAKLKSDLKEDRIQRLIDRYDHHDN